ncbi:hypothetical protein GALMADRAFT_462464 [Galerina marginata CBS 339.88]|uniref:Decapping nuclease n=1 Tax=Galerina marginata (strain CBS 339.88) TaxID=685588 RepID=A0A067TAV3_GALM3|nr:hypothetical protein GALMADRAFT_462464 [Galerina marginata CBS 339.88]
MEHTRSKPDSDLASGSQATRKRGVSDLLNEAKDRDDATDISNEPPKTRRRVDRDKSPLKEHREQPSGAGSTEKAGQVGKNVVSQAPAFLSYPDPSNSKPKAIPFQQPSQLISFSYTPEHVQEFTDSALRYYVDPPLGSNLSYGYDRWVRKPDQRGRIDALLKAISNIKHDPKRGVGLPEIGVVSWRGVMTKILTAPYENRDGWELNVMSLNGTLYLEEHLTEDRLSEKNNMDARQRSQTYYGYAFESYCTSDAPPGRAPHNNPNPGAPPSWGGDVDTSVQWCSVVRTKLGDTRMIIGGEVDCVRGKYTGQTDTFVELKTSLTIRGQHDESKFERKLLKFYFQSFLLGVPEIVVGFRTPAGVVTTVQSFKTIQLPRLVRGKPGAWDPVLCLDWGYKFLTFLKDLVRSTAGDSDSSVWRVKFVPASGVSVEALDSKGIEDVVNGEDRVGFLPKWYWEEIRREEHARLPDEKVTPASKLANAGWQI